MKKSSFKINYEIENHENNLTSFAGAPLLFDFFKTIGLEKILSESFPDHGKQGYSNTHQILSLVLVNFLGGDSVSDIEYLEQDSGLKKLFIKFESSSKVLNSRDFRRGRSRIFSK